MMWREKFDAASKKFSRDFREYGSSTALGRDLWPIGPRETSELADQIREYLVAYDKMRSDYIAFLKNRVMELDMLLPRTYTIPAEQTRAGFAAVRGAEQKAAIVVGACEAYVKEYREQVEKILWNTLHSSSMAAAICDEIRNLPLI
jgi:hypothetical protein